MKSFFLTALALIGVLSGYAALFSVDVEKFSSMENPTQIEESKINASTVSVGGGVTRKAVDMK